MTYPDYPIIDIHIHIQPWWQLKPDVQKTMAMKRENYEDLLDVMRRPERFLQMMDDANIERAGLINYVSPDLMGFDDSCCEYVLDYALRFRDRMIPFCSVNPRFRKDCGARMRQMGPRRDAQAPHGAAGC